MIVLFVKDRGQKTDEAQDVIQENASNSCMESQMIFKKMDCFNHVQYAAFEMNKGQQIPSDLNYKRKPKLHGKVAKFPEKFENK